MSWVWSGSRPAEVLSAQPHLPGVSVRLAYVAAQARTDGGVADIGTDHAHLLLAMVRAGWARRGIGIDRAAAPLRAAGPAVAAAGRAIELRQGEGLTPLRPDEVDTVVVAGVGGRTAVSVLQEPALTSLGVRRIVVQPNRDDAMLRAHLFATGWPLVGEGLVLDGDRLFYVGWAERGPARPLGVLDRWLGPHLRARQGPLERAFRLRRAEWLRQRPWPTANVAEVLEALKDA